MIKPRSVTVRVHTAVSRFLTPSASRSRYVDKRIIWGASKTIKEKTIKAFEGQNLPNFENANWPLTIDYTIARGKGRRMMDEDNAVYCMKYVQDGIMKALGIDDSNFTPGRVVQIKSEDPKKPYIDITITEADHADPRAGTAPQVPGRRVGRRG